jgi:hypothetical protein
MNISYRKSNGELTRLKELAACDSDDHPFTIEELQEEIQNLKEIIKKLKENKDKK